MSWETAGDLEALTVGKGRRDPKSSKYRAPGLLGLAQKTIEYLLN